MCNGSLSLSYLEMCLHRSVPPSSLRVQRYNREWNDITESATIQLPNLPKLPLSPLFLISPLFLSGECTVLLLLLLRGSHLPTSAPQPLIIPHTAQMHNCTAQDCMLYNMCTTTCTKVSRIQNSRDVPKYFATVCVFRDFCANRIFCPF